jgi:hypothetical protein
MCALGAGKRRATMPPSTVTALAATGVVSDWLLCTLHRIVLGHAGWLAGFG